MKITQRINQVGSVSNPVSGQNELQKILDILNTDLNKLRRAQNKITKMMNKLNPEDKKKQENKLMLLKKQEHYLKNIRNKKSQELLSLSASSSHQSSASNPIITTEQQQQQTEIENDPLLKNVIKLESQIKKLQQTQTQKITPNNLKIIRDNYNKIEKQYENLETKLSERGNDVKNLSESKRELLKSLNTDITQIEKNMKII